MRVRVFARPYVWVLLAIFAWVTQACTKGQVTHYEIESEASVLPQCSGQYTSAQIVQPEMQPLFKPSTEVKLALECAVYWVRLRFNDSLVGKTLVLSHRHIDTILLVTQNADGALAHLVNGENIVFSKRPIANGEFPSLPFTVPETGEVFLRMASTSNYSLHFRSFKRFRIEQATLFYPKLDNARYFHGIFFGVMVAMILFNLFIYFVYRDYMYLVYTVFMVTQTVYHLSITGFLREFFLPDLPEIAKLAPFFIAGISLMSYIWFSQVYLLSKHYAPRLNKVLNALYLIIIVTSALGFFFFIEVANSILLTCGLAVVTVPFFIAIIGLKQHYRPAIFFLIASVLSYVGYYLFTMLRFELVPSIFLTRYSYQIMFALQGLLFAMGLGDRMNRIKKELALNKIKQAELEREKERELKELLEQQNEMLEKKVTERTAELVEQNKIIEQDKQIINLERKKSDDLLRNILPDTIAVRLKGGEEMIADHFEAVSVFFSDIVGFTSLSSSMHPAKLVTLLNLLFTEFDKLVKEHGLEKIKTIGDAYMCVCGLPTPVDDHAMRMANFASAALSAVEKINEETGSKLAVRVGISSGSAVAGVIGNTKFAYDLWGETVNIASRLESSGEPMKIYTTEAFKNLAESKFNFTFKGMLDLKGMGEHPVYIMNC